MAKGESINGECPAACGKGTAGHSGDDDMCLIAQEADGVYSVRVITPRGVVYEVEQYGLRRMVRALGVANAVYDLFGRCPTSADPEAYREVWQMIAESNEAPRLCSVEIVERVDYANEHAPHGWRRVLIRTPRVARRVPMGV